MIELKNVSKSYNGIYAARDLSFTIKKGEILGFLGPNGAGKTTTMKMITCYMPPTEGSIQFEDLDVVADSLAVRRKIGYLPEETPLYGDMSVQEYLTFVANVRGIPKAEIQSAINKVVDECGLGSVTSKDIGELSKGYNQRVGLAQALIHDPDVLVLDEPTSGLDPNQIIEIRNLIKELGARKTVIFSTHIMQEVQAVCDRVLIINEGRIAAQGTAEELEASVAGQQLIHLKVLGASKDELKKGLLSLDNTLIKSVKGTKQKSEADLASMEGADLREAIFDMVVAKHWKLLELTPGRLSLEDVFRRLTEGNAGGAA